MAEIVPAIISSSESELKEMVSLVESSAKRIQIDILDGEFVSEKTISVNDLVGLGTSSDIEVHLMALNPEKYFDVLLNSEVKAVIGHIETLTNISAFISSVKSAGKEAGVAINPETDINQDLEDSILEADFVQFMTVNPGKYGAPFLPKVLENILKFHSIHPEFKISVDGGINIETGNLAVKAGAERLVIGSAIFKDKFKTPIEALNSFNEIFS